MSTFATDLSLDELKVETDRLFNRRNVRITFSLKATEDTCQLDAKLAEPSQEALRIFRGTNSLGRSMQLNGGNP